VHEQIWPERNEQLIKEVIFTLEMEGSEKNLF